MIDRTIARAARQGARTQPAPRASSRKPRKSKSPALSPEQIAQAVQDARSTRIQADLLDYSRSHPMQHTYDDAHSLLYGLEVSCV
ncbi:hypothetical protein AB0N33_00955 [Pseudarthrobacter oxydans]|uniref:hypothetical protein n=1 Tax=Pseudarthrobacter oxydans TaxID=1671 RepID=UPI0034204508